MKRRKLGRVAVIDMETDPFLHDRVPKPFLIGFYDGETYMEFRRTSALLAYLETREPLTLYAHNGGKFDFHYIVERAPAYTEYMIINGRVVAFELGKHEFRDSYAILPIALEEYQKTKIDYSWFEDGERQKHMAKIRAYLKSDCVNLYNLVIQFVRDYGEKITLALSALTYWRNMDPDQRDGVNSTRYYFERLHPYYYGGRVQAFQKGIFEGLTRIYDINSAYPFAMSQSHPFGTKYRVSTGPGAEGFKPHCFYCIDATSHGALPVRQGPKLEYPHERGVYFATGHEILAGLETGTLDIHNTLERVTFERTISFKAYVDYFYNIKRSAPRNSPQYIFAKLLMNSFYGKLAADPTHYNHFMSIPASKIRAHMKIGWQYYGLINEKIALVFRPLARHERHYYNLATAASITGSVRAMLWRSICGLRGKGNVVFYCDTDSVITDGTLPCGDALGAWKLEQQSDMLAIAERKLYAARKTKIGKPNEPRWKIASKGAQLNARQICKIARGGKVTYNAAPPTFRLGKDPTFVSREIQRRALP